MDNTNAKTLKKQRMVTAIVIVLAISVVGLIFLMFDKKADNTEPEKTDETTIRPLLAIPNWGEDIYEDEEWLDKNRYITYIDGGMSVTITDEDYEAYGICTQFMALYFEALMQGSADALCGFYADEYFDTNYKWDEITMQRIYDMKLECMGTSYTMDETIYVYKVSYKIMKNDGTFRNDVKSDAERPEYFTIVESEHDIKITDVSYSYNP